MHSSLMQTLGRSKSIKRRANRHPLVVERKEWTPQQWTNIKKTLLQKKKYQHIRFKGKLPMFGSDGQNIAEDFALILSNKQLQLLELVDTNFDSLLAQKLSQLLIPNKHLVVLNLAQNFLKDEGTLSLASTLAKNKMLCHLNLSRNEITDVGLQSLTDIGLKKNKRLKTLVLSHNAFTPSAISDFALALPQCHLKAVDVCGMDISEKGAKYFREAMESKQCDLDFVWLESDDSFFRESMFKSLILSSDRLVELVQDIQQSRFKDRFGNITRESVQVFNFDAALTTEKILKTALDVDAATSKLINNNIGAVLKLLKPSLSSNSVAKTEWDLVESAAPDRISFCYDALFSVMQDPLVRSELLSSFVSPRDNDILEFDARKKSSPISKTQSVTRMPQHRQTDLGSITDVFGAGLGSLEGSPRMQPVLMEATSPNLRKSNKRASSFFFQRRHQNTNKTNQTLGRTNGRSSQKMMLKFNDSDLTIKSQKSGTSFKSHASFNAFDSFDLRRNESFGTKRGVSRGEGRSSIDLVFSKKDFDKVQFNLAFKRFLNKAAVIGLQYSDGASCDGGDVIPLASSLLRGRLTQILVINESDLLKDAESIINRISKIISSVQSLKLVQTFILLKDSQNGAESLIEAAKLVESRVDSKIHWFLFEKFSQQRQELFKVFFTQHRDNENHHLVSSKALDSYRQWITKTVGEKILPGLPISTSDHFTALENAGLILHRKGFVLLKPSWILTKTRKLAYPQKLLKQHFKSTRTAVSGKKVDAICNHGNATISMLQVLLQNDHLNLPTSGERNRFIKLLQDLDIVAGDFFVNFKDRFKVFLVVPRPLKFKEQKVVNMVFALDFQFSEPLAPFFFQHLGTRFCNSFHHEIRRLKKQMDVMVKGKKKKVFGRKLYHNKFTQPQLNIFQLEKKQSSIRLTYEEKDLILSFQTDNEQILKKMYDFCRALLQQINFPDLDENRIFFVEREPVTKQIIQKSAVSDLKKSLSFPFEIFADKERNNSKTRMKMEHNSKRESSNFEVVNKSESIVLEEVKQKDLTLFVTKLIQQD